MCLRILNLFFAIISLTVLASCVTTEKSDDAKLQNSIAEIDNISEQQKFTSLAQEWEAMKPALVSLIALESDLKYFLENIENAAKPLPSTASLQQLVQSQEKLNAFETMSFDESQDLTENFSDTPEEVKKLKEESVFADEQLLEELELAILETESPKKVISPTQETRSVVPSLELAVETVADDLELSLSESKKENELTVSAVASVPNYLKDTETQNRNIANVNVDRQNASKTNIKPQLTTYAASLSSSITTKNLKNATRPPTDATKSNIHTLDKSSISSIDSKFSRLTRDNNQVKSQTDKTCEPAATIPGQGYALHLASYSSELMLEKGWSEISRQYKQYVCGLIPAVDKVTVSSKEYYSLRIGGFINKQSAEARCSLFDKQGAYCRVIKFEGKAIL
uniref:SPOR domain-containing protein n=1 Tax=Ningiella ruwaisensis TaxID=2364274 RepID=UPI0010A050D3|nr:SPOR domain-containing protein [Ningiella ruwaisensis]